jgi:hypothetical protein
VEKFSSVEDFFKNFANEEKEKDFILFYFSNVPLDMNNKGMKVKGRK